MKIVIDNKNLKPHALYLRVCPVCGKHFMRFHKARKWCSTKCRDIDGYKKYFNKGYRGKALKIRRQNERREKMRNEIPKIKQAMAQGDDSLLQYLLDTFYLNPIDKRNPNRKYNQAYERSIRK